MFPTPSRLVRTRTFSFPSAPIPVPVPTTSGIRISSGVCAFWARIVSATSAALCADRAVFGALELEDPVIEPTLLQLERTRASAAKRRRVRTINRVGFLGILGFLLRR